MTTYRKDGGANVSPVWFRWQDDAFEIVIARGDVKLKHLARDPRCVFLVFEVVPPFRGIEVRGVPELVERDVTADREDIAGRYLGADGGRRFAAARTSKPGVLLRLPATHARVSGISRRSCPLLSQALPRCASVRESPEERSGRARVGFIPWTCPGSSTCRVNVSDFRRAVAWYEGILGLTARELLASG